jgi:hypothetical protein
MYTWKYHKETPSVATIISNKQKCHVFLFSFFFYKIGGHNRSAGVVRGVGTSEGGR